VHAILGVEHHEVILSFFAEFAEHCLLQQLILADDGGVQLILISDEDQSADVELEIAKGVGPRGLCCLIQDGDIWLKEIFPFSFVVDGSRYNCGGDDDVCVVDRFGEGLHVDGVEFVADGLLLDDAVDVPFDFLYR
jgi:hypothetical protein